jgi:hypothetical protein
MAGPGAEALILKIRLCGNVPPGQGCRTAIDERRTVMQL